MKKILFILSLCVSNFISGGEKDLMPSTNAVPSTANKITEKLKFSDLEHRHKEFREQLQKELSLDSDFFIKLYQKDLKSLKNSTKNLKLEDIKALQTWCTERQSFIDTKGEKCCMCMGATCIVGGFYLWNSDPIPNVGPELQPTVQAKFLGTLMGIVGFFLGATGSKSADKKDKELLELAKINNDLLKLKKINVNDKFPEEVTAPSKKSPQSTNSKSKTD